MLWALVQKYDPGSLTELLLAAACSPTAGHRLPSIAIALGQLAQCRSGGTEPASVDVLGELLDAARATQPGLSSREDFVPNDPRVPTLFRFRDSLFRIYSGEIERPFMELERIALLSESIDDFLVDRLGFGLGDLLEVALGYMDAVVAQVSQAWTDLPLSLDRVPSVEAAECVRIAQCPDIAEIADSCSDATRAQRALAWATAHKKSIRVDVSQPDSSFGPFLALDSPNTGLVAPVGFLLGACIAASAELARLAASDSASRDRYWLRGASRVERLLKSLGPIAAGPNFDGGPSLCVLVRVSERHYLLVDLVAELDSGRINDVLETAARRLESIRPGSSFRAIGVRGAIPVDAEVVRLVVIASAGSLMLGVPDGIEVLPLGDLEAITASMSEPDDLFLFLRDLAAKSQIGRMFAFSAADVFETWLAGNGSLHSGGRFLDLITFQAGGAGSSEWQRAGDRSRFEAALAALGLPGFSSWPHSKFREDAVDLIDVDRGEGWIVSLGPPLVGIRLDLPSEATPEDVRMIENLAGTTRWLLREVDSQFRVLLKEATGIESVTIAFVAVPPSTAVPIRMHPTSESWIEIHCDQGALVLGALEPGAAERLLAEAVAAGLVLRAADPGKCAPLAQAFNEACAQMGPGFVVEFGPLAQERSHLGEPLRPHAYFRAVGTQDVAKRLADSDVRVDTYSGPEAVTLDSKTIYPALLEPLVAECDGWDRTALLLSAAEELERAAAFRARTERQIRLDARQEWAGDDWLDRATESSSTSSHLHACIGLVIDYALTASGTGEGSPDRLDWRRLISRASLCVDSGLRAEGTHYGLLPHDVEVTSLYELRFRALETALIDLDMYRAALTIFAQQSDEAPPLPPDGEATVAAAEGPLGWLETRPELHEIDAALRTEWGFGLHALFAVMVRCQEWPVQGQTVALTDDESIVRHCMDGDGPPEAEVQAAVRALTLRRQDVAAAPIEPWDQQKRTARLVTQPIIAVDDTQRIVLPWWSGGALIVYLRYLADGALPWPDPALGPNLRAAVDSYRTRRNREFEDQVSLLATCAGRVVRTRIRKPQAIGLDQLAGEIDVLVVDPGSKKLSVIEAKDPDEVFSISQMERSVRKFHRPGEWVDKLLQKVADVRKAPESVATAVGVSEAGPWDVEGLMVTRRPVPAAYVEDPRVPFVIARDLPERLKNVRAEQG